MRTHTHNTTFKRATIESAPLLFPTASEISPTTDKILCFWWRTNSPSIPNNTLPSDVKNTILQFTATHPNLFFILNDHSSITRSHLTPHSLLKQPDITLPDAPALPNFQYAHLIFSRHTPIVARILDSVSGPFSLSITDLTTNTILSHHDAPAAAAKHLPYLHESLSVAFFAGHNQIFIPAKSKYVFLQPPPKFLNKFLSLDIVSGVWTILHYWIEGDGDAIEFFATDRWLVISVPRKQSYKYRGKQEILLHEFPLECHEAICIDVSYDIFHFGDFRSRTCWWDRPDGKTRIVFWVVKGHRPPERDEYNVFEYDVPSGKLIKQHTLRYHEGIVWICVIGGRLCVVHSAQRHGWKLQLDWYDEERSWRQWSTQTEEYVFCADHVESIRRYLPYGPVFLQD